MKKLAAVLLFLSIPLSFCDAEQVTGMTEGTTESSFTGTGGAIPISFEGNNEFDFSGDGGVERRRNYELTIGMSEAQPLTPDLENGFRAADLGIDSNLSRLLIPHPVARVARLEGFNEPETYDFVSPALLGIEINSEMGSDVVLADASAYTEFGETAKDRFAMENRKRSVSKNDAKKKDYVINTSAKTDAEELNNSTPPNDPVDLTPVPELAVQLVVCAAVMALAMRRRRQR